MSLWTLSNPPSWAPNAIATPKGWVNPDTGEVLVTIGSLDQRSGPAAIRGASVIDNKGVYQTGDTFRFRVFFSEPVVVVGIPTISVDIGNATINLSYASGSGTAALDFTYVFTGENGALVMDNPTTISGGGLHDVAPTDWGLTVDRTFDPPSPMPMVEGDEFEQTDVPMFQSIIATYDPIEGPFYLPGQVLTVNMAIQDGVSDVSDINRVFLRCSSNGNQFVMTCSGFDETGLVFTWPAPNVDTYNDDTDIQYLTLELNDGEGPTTIVTPHGTYTSPTTFDLTEVSVGNPNVTIAIVPVVLEDVTVDPMEVTEPGDIEITLTLSSNITSVTAPEGVKIQYRSGQSGAPCDYVSHTGNTITFSGPVVNSLFNNSGLNPFYIFAMDIATDSSINTEDGSLVGGFTLDYFDVDPEPDINIQD